MQIQKAKPKEKLVRIDEMESGEVFLNNGIHCMKLMYLLECKRGEDYNAIDLSDGEPIFFNEDEEFEMAEYDFIAK